MHGVSLKLMSIWNLRMCLFSENTVFADVTSEVKMRSQWIKLRHNIIFDVFIGG